MENHARPLPEPDYDDEKELYSFFGLAFYWVQVFEHSVINLAAALHVGQAKSITTKFIDELWANLDAKTLGQLVNATRTLTKIPDDTDHILSELLKKRNYLAHHFFKINSELMLAESGRRKMIDELRNLTNEFRRGDKVVESMYLLIWARFGVTEEVIAREIEIARNRAILGDNRN